MIVVQRFVQMTENSKARQSLTGAQLDPGNMDTSYELRRNFKKFLIIMMTILWFWTALYCENACAVHTQWDIPGGCTNEHLKMLLDGPFCFDSFANLMKNLAREHVSQKVAKAHILARITALRKPAGEARGIATGTCLRCLTTRTLARQIGQKMKDAFISFSIYIIYTRWYK